MAAVKDTNISILREYFPNLSMSELKEVAKEDRQELADGVRALTDDERGFSIA